MRNVCKGKRFPPKKVSIHSISAGFYLEKTSVCQTYNAADAIKVLNLKASILQATMGLCVCLLMQR